SSWSVRTRQIEGRQVPAPLNERLLDPAVALFIRERQVRVALDDEAHGVLFRVKQAAEKNVRLITDAASWGPPLRRHEHRRLCDLAAVKQRLTQARPESPAQVQLRLDQVSEKPRARRRRLGRRRIKPA